MTRTAWRMTWVIVWLAAAAAACSEPRCPRGYDKRGDTCYRIKDAGPDVGTEVDLDDGGGDDDGGEDLDEDRSPVSTGDAGRGLELDGGNESNVQADDAGSALDAISASCALACGEHQVCQVVGGSEQCACATGYATCEGQSKCIDVMKDPLNCGSCGYACAEGLSCKQGGCEQRIRELVLDSFVSCALYDSPDGNYPLRCWGDGTFGLFRDGVMEATGPREVAGVPRVRALALTGSRYCVVLPGQDTIRCWGACGLECGNTEMATTGSAFARDVALPGVVQISGTVGGENSYLGNTCGRTGAGVLWCWGGGVFVANSQGSASPRPISIEGNGTFRDVDGGYYHTCAVVSDGRVGCWGWPQDDILGVAAESFPAAEPPWWPGVIVQKEGGGILTGATKVACGSTSCAVTQGGELWCWGPNGGAWRTPAGLLGVGDAARHVGAVKVALENVVDVALGWGAQACAIAGGGQVYCRYIAGGTYEALAWDRVLLVTKETLLSRGLKRCPA
jgi:hypothetical protein